MSSISSSPSNSASQHHSFLADQDVLLTTFKVNFLCKVCIEVLTTIEFNLINENNKGMKGIKNK